MLSKKILLENIALLLIVLNLFNVSSSFCISKNANGRVREAK